MAIYEINGGHPLNGTVTISGAKNAAVAILPAALLVSGKCRIENIPDISDVRILLDILDGMGADIHCPGPHVVEIDCTAVHCTEPNKDLVEEIRASYYLVGALLGIIGYTEATAFDPAVTRGIFNMACIAPIIGFVCIVLALAFLYPLNKKKVEENVAELAARRNK